MNHQLLSGLTATLLITNLSGAPSGYADSTDPADQAQTANLVATDSATTRDAIVRDSSTTSAPVAQPQIDIQTSAIAEILPHEVSGRRAATLYVRDIPVLTFLGSRSTNSQQHPEVPTLRTFAAQSSQAGQSESLPSESLPVDGGFQLSQLQNDPVWRAMALATQLNYLNQQQIDAKTITVKWETSGTAKEVSMLPPLNAEQRLAENQTSLVAGIPTLDTTTFPAPTLPGSDNSPIAVVPPSLAGNSQKGRYVIQVGDSNLLVMDANIILSDTTKNQAQDALQATNRLRRLLGNAPPLKEIAGLPRIEQQVVAYRTPKRQFTGMASWYGPGFHGNYSANGEVFNQYALTAAHPNLPFGTLVKVTNMTNGRSVVVRINDRGPYAGGRIIDLSRGAAEALGMVSTGVAQVSVEILE